MYNCSLLYLPCRLRFETTLSKHERMVRTRRKNKRIESRTFVFTISKISRNEKLQVCFCRRRPSLLFGTMGEFVYAQQSEAHSFIKDSHHYCKAQEVSVLTSLWKYHSMAQEECYPLTLYIQHLHCFSSKHISLPFCTASRSFTEEQRDKVARNLAFTRWLSSELSQELKSVCMCVSSEWWWKHISI